MADIAEPEPAPALSRRNRVNLTILALATALNRSAPPLVVLAGGLVGLLIAPSPVWATLPVALVVVGMGAFSYPAAAIMKRLGRRTGLVLGSGAAALAQLGAAAAIMAGSFVGFCIAMTAIGANQAFVHQYRFAAAENVPASRVSYAISLMLLSGLVSAYVGPELGRVGRDWIVGAPFAGGFLAVAGLNVVAGILLLGYQEFDRDEVESDEPIRPTWQIVRQPVYIVAAAAAGLSYAVMSLIMTAAPISMHSMHGHSLQATALTIESHIAAMYLPSLFTGALVVRLGVYRAMVIGVVILFGCVVIASWRQGVIHYWLALVMLGVGWNFLFTAGSTLITTTYTHAERFRAQGVNDLIVFGTMAVVSLAAGVLLEYAGWRFLTLSTLPLLALMLALVWDATLRSKQAAHEIPEASRR